MERDKLRIDGLSAAARAALIAAVADKAATDGAGFKTDGPAAPPPPPPQAQANALAPPPTSIAMLVALASIDPAVEKRRKQAAGADRGLSLLETLRDQLSAGLATPEQLQEMRTWVDQAGVPDDPVLADVLRDIELRVRVELAKHDLTA